VGPSTYALRLSDDEQARYRLMADRARAEEGDLWAAAGLGAGARVADVGCGPGAMLVALAEMAGPTGHVVGVDGDAEAVAAARAALSAARSADPRVAEGEVRQGRADDTGIPAGSVDTAVLRHVLAHNGGAEQRIVDHLAALVRPGGHVYLLDVDLTTATSSGIGPEIDELLDRYTQWHASRGNDPQVGRRLPELARRSGLAVTAHRCWTLRVAVAPGMRGPAWAAREELVRAGLATADDLVRWSAAFTARDAAQSAEPPAFALDVVAVVGRRPASPEEEQ
jgi:SAM-dependent methyltransferase